MPEVTFSSKGAEKVIAEQERLNKKVGEGLQNYRLTAEEAKRFERVAVQIARNAESAQDTYNRKLDEARKALAGNKNETELLAKETTRLKVEYLRSADANKKLAAERTEQFKKAHAELGNFATKLQDVDKSQERTFGAAAKARVTAYLAGLLSVRDVLNDYNTLLDDQATKAISTGAATGALGQLSKGDPAKLKRMTDAARQTFREGAFETLPEAMRLQFELESAGASGERSFFSRLAAIDPDAAQVATSSSLVRQAFGAEGGSFEQIASKGLAAADPATGANLSQMLEGVAKASKAGQALGLSDEQVFAAVTQVAKVTGNASEAGDRVRALFTSLTRKGYADEKRGQSLSTTIKEIGAQGMSQAQLVEYFGREEARFAFDILKDTGGLEATLGQINQAQSTNLARRTIDTAMSDRTVRGRRERLAAAAEKELGLEADAAIQNRIKTRRDRLFGRNQQSVGTFGASVVDTISGLASWLTPNGIEGALTPETNNSMERVGALLEEQNRIAKDQVKEQQETNRKIGQGGGLIGVAQ